MMERRAFIGSFAVGTLAVTRVTHVQAARKIYRIGILTLGSASRMVGPGPKLKRAKRSCVDCASSATCMASIL